MLMDAEGSKVFPRAVNQFGLSWAGILKGVSVHIIIIIIYCIYNFKPMTVGSEFSLSPSILMSYTSRAFVCIGYKISSWSWRYLTCYSLCVCFYTLFVMSCLKISPSSSPTTSSFFFFFFFCPSLKTCAR